MQSSVVTFTLHAKSVQYAVYQVEGQKYAKLCGEERPAGAQCEVYVSNLPRNAAIEDVLRLFMRAGKVLLVRLLMDFSGYNRGCCFVLYATVRECREAICCLHEERIQEHTIAVKLSLSNDQLILKSIPSWLPMDEIKEMISNYIGGDGIERIVVRPSRLPYKKYCFCHFKDHLAAVKAHKKIWPYLNLQGNIIDVHWATPVMIRKLKNLYFTNYSAEMGKREFFEIVASKLNIADVIQIRYFPNMTGYITFVSGNALDTGAARLLGLTIRGFKLKFSQMPFTSTGQDRLSEEFFESHRLRPPPRQAPGSWSSSSSNSCFSPTIQQNANAPFPQLFPMQSVPPGFLNPIGNYMPMPPPPMQHGQLMQFCPPGPPII